MFACRSVPVFVRAVPVFARLTGLHAGCHRCRNMSQTVCDTFQSMHAARSRAGLVRATGTFQQSQRFRFRHPQGARRNSTQEPTAGPHGRPKTRGHTRMDAARAPAVRRLRCCSSLLLLAAAPRWAAPRFCSWVLSVSPALFVRCCRCCRCLGNSPFVGPTTPTTLSQQTPTKAQQRVQQT